MSEETELTALSLIDLTDEELAGIDTRPEAARLVVYPYLDDLDEHDRGQAIAVALRGLAARGLIQPPTKAGLAAALAAPSRSGTVDIEMDAVLVQLLQLRVALRVVCAQRMLGEEEGFCYLYFPDDASEVLEESVDSAGLHRFRLHNREHAAEVIGLFFNPSGHEGLDGEALAIDAAAAAADGTPSELLERLGRSTCSGEFFLRHMDHGSERPPMLGIFSGPDGLFFSETEFGSAKPVQIAPVSAPTLLDRIAGALR